MEANEKFPKNRPYSLCADRASRQRMKKRKSSSLLALYIALTHSEGVSAREREREGGDYGQERRDRRVRGHKDTNAILC